MIAEMLKNADVKVNIDYLKNRAHWDAQAVQTLYTGAIDAFYNYQFGALEYRCVRFETETLKTDNYQGNAVINYTDFETPYTRIIEHKHFTPNTVATTLLHTIISHEHSAEWRVGEYQHYPVGGAKNAEIYAKYRALVECESRYIFGGRLAEYAYFDMDQIVKRALKLISSLLLI
jgi:UDP-galactopyranose mutase